MDFTKYNCSVCGQTFNENDDVVVCPDCGTPHHRECWFKNGACINENKHNSGEPIEVNYKQIEPEEETAENAVHAQSVAYFGNQNDPVNENKNTAENEPQKIVQEIFNEMQNNSGERISIDNIKLSYFEAVIGKNKEYYIPRFMLFEKVKKAFSWNIAGFLVPLAWTLYRKMYGFAALIFAVYVLIAGVTALPLITNEEYLSASQVCMEEDPQYSVKILMYSTGASDVTLTPNQVKLYEIMEKIQIPSYVSIGSYVILLALRIAMGIFGTHLYYKTLRKKIQKARTRTINEESLKMYLFKKGGTLPFIICAIIGFFEWQMF